MGGKWRQHEICSSQRPDQQIVKIHKEFKPGTYSKIFDIDDFAFRKVYLDLLETDENGEPVFETKEISISQNKINDIVLVESPKHEKLLKELKDKKGKEGTFTFDIDPKSELVEKYRTPDTQITIRKTFNGNSVSLKATINIPKVVKDTEYIPWKDDKLAFLEKEVEKQWTITAEEKGYEIPFTKHFYVYQPLRKPEEVSREITELEHENVALMKELGLIL
jgi:type I restriction enzyme M protein